VRERSSDFGRFLLGVVIGAALPAA